MALTAHAGVEATEDHAGLAELLRAVNELEVEPAAPDDFFAVGRVQLTVVLADGRRLSSEVAAGRWRARVPRLTPRAGRQIAGTSTGAWVRAVLLGLAEDIGDEFQHIRVGLTALLVADCPERLLAPGLAPHFLQRRDGVIVAVCVVILRDPRQHRDQ